MNRFRILKKLRSKLKRDRRHILSLGALAVLFMLAVLAGSLGAFHLIKINLIQPAPQEDSLPVWLNESSINGSEGRSPDQTAAAQSIITWKGQVEVVVHRQYLCGEETRRLGAFSPEAAITLLKAHREWVAHWEGKGKLRFDEVIDDLSPECRKSAFIGMDKDGNLSLYDGPPSEDHVVRTFFQMDVGMMETNLSREKKQELSTGIRVSDKAEYNSVISTYSEYASSSSVNR